MSIVKKKILLLILTVTAIVTCCVAVLFNYTAVSAAKVFNCDNGVECVENSKVSDEFYGGRKGYLFKSSVARSGFSLKNGMAGRFSIKFLPVSDENGQANFKELSFAFSSAESRLGFTLKYIATEKGVTLRLVLSNSASNTKDFAVDGSFSNLADEPMAFSFDPEKMVVYDVNGTPIIDLKSQALLDEFRMTTAFDSYGLYNVDVKFGSIETGKEAKVIIFDICEQSLDSNPLTDTSAPIIYKDVILDSGVVGSKYALRTDVATYDIIDGIREAFVGDIKVTDTKGNAVELVNNSFTPESSGVYYAFYTPEDSSGNKGETVTCKFRILSYRPDAQFVLEYPLENRTVGVGTRVAFPSVTLKSELTANSIAVKATITAADSEEEIYAIEDCKNGFNYTFGTAGTYILTLSATDANGYKAENQYSVSVRADAPVYGVYVNDEYAKNVNLDLNTAVCTLNGQDKEVKALTVYPSGKTQTSKVITLDENGTYKTVFSIEGSDVVYEKYFNVRNSNSTLWEENEALSVTADVTAPDYADYAYNGTMLTVSRKTEAIYKNTIDLSDNSENDLLCEFFVAPSIAGNLETATIDIILTDVYDQSNVVDIRFTKGIWNLGDENRMMSVMALTQRDYTLNTLGEVNKSGTDTQRLYYYTTRVYSSLYGKISNANEDYASQSVKVYFDYETGCVYVDNATKNSAYGKALVCDLTDEKYVGTGNAYEKFTTGEARFSIVISDLKQESHVMVLNVDGQSLSGEYSSDTVAPSIFINYAGNSADALPVGVVGKAYNIFDAYSIDLVDGKNTDVKISVFKKGEILQEYEFNGKRFIPDSAGEYVIRYTTTDNVGLTSVKEITVSVVTEDEYRPLSFVFDENNQKNATVGYDYFYLGGEAKGGTGAITQTVTVKRGNFTVELDQSGAFFVDKPGEYVVSVVLKDYINESEPFVFTINASYSDKPIIEEKTMPTGATVGQEIVFPTFTAKRFSQSYSDGENVEVEIYVNGAEITGGKYVPQQAGDLSVLVKAGDSEISYVVHVVESVASGSADYTKQFFYSDAEITTSNTAVQFAFDKDAYISLTKLIDENFIKFVLTGNATKNAYSEIRCVITDSVDPSVKVTLTVLKKNETEAYIVINGERYVINGSFSNPNASFSIGYDATTYKINVGNSDVAVIKTTDSGKTFEGFKSGKAYLEFYTSGVSGEGVLGIGAISGQTLSKRIRQDVSGPTINVLGDFDEIKKGEQLIIPAAKAFDFFSGVESLSVSVLAPNGTYLLKDADISESLSVTASYIGKYTIIYSAKDYLGNESSNSTYSYSVSITDSVPPVITLSGTVQTTGSVGKKITLPKMTATDDNTPQDELLTYVYYIAPNGQVVKITDYSFEPSQKGQYVVIYFAQDGDGSTAIRRFVIEVK